MAKTRTREDWLQRAVERLAADGKFGEVEVPTLRVSVGFPKGRARAGKAIGQCWYSAEDGVAQIFVSPVLTDPVEVLATLAHEVCHAIVGPGQGHGAAFGKVARRAGLEGKLTATHAGAELGEYLRTVAGRLGEYGHAKLDPADEQPKGVTAKQTTRMLKVCCPECGCTVRMAQKWLTEVGAPVCNGCEIQMEVAL